MPEFEVDTINIKAVKAAYLDGSLEIRPGYRTYWVGGKQKSDYVNKPISIGSKPHEVFLAMGPGGEWISRVEGRPSRFSAFYQTQPYSQLASYVAFQP